MDVNIKDVRDAVKAKPLAELREDRAVSGVSTDTRTIAKDDLFFALKGVRFDAHDFLKEAFEKGARHFVVSDPKRVPAELKRSANVLVVQDTLQAYGDLAKAYRQKFRVPAVAITGSSGKTTVKELTAHVLSQKFKVLKNRGTENNLVGVPKTLLGLDPSYQVMVIEMGTNRPGEIDRLSS
ncbi:MAG TPA: Mur ligase family protein, partial [Candidatus Omnitrophota bacterium]|nr:Mur ligase family protein [Candidatus Omnitrophota bacterium]